MRMQICWSMSALGQKPTSATQKRVSALLQSGHVQCNSHARFVPIAKLHPSAANDIYSITSLASRNQGRWYGEAERRMSALVIGDVYFTPKSGHLSVV